MHAYRDAIRDNEAHHIVRFAAILYPGATKFFGRELAALQSQPLARDELHTTLAQLLGDALQPHLPLKADR